MAISVNTGGTAIGGFLNGNSLDPRTEDDIAEELKKKRKAMLQNASNAQNVPMANGGAFMNFMGNQS